MTDAKRFAGRVAIVTGAAGGIGLATALRLANEGAYVTLADCARDKLAAAAEKVKESGAPGVWASGCDVSSEDQVSATVGGTLDRYGRLDVIINNAGMMVFKPLVEHSQDDWLGILAINLLGPFFLIRQAFRSMRAEGAIINVASIHAVRTTPLVASYAAAKAALISLTRSAAIEGKKLGIRVNAVLPVAIDTPMLSSNPNIRLGHEKVDPADVGRPEDVARAIAFLASDDAHFIQGATLRVDGGRLSRL